MVPPFVAVAGITGTLGQLIAKALRTRGVAVKGIVRPGTDESRIKELRDANVAIVPINLNDVPALTRELTGATCVVCALQGLKDVVIDSQGNLLDAAVSAKVSRFIPSDFALDFTKTKPGSNRNLDLRREFHGRLDKSEIAWTSVLNGAFLDMLSSDMSPINIKKRTIMYAGSPTQLLDYTTMSDTAAYTAAVAADPNPTPRILRIAGYVANANDLAAAAAEVEKAPFRLRWIGSVWFMEIIISILKLFGGKNDTMPMWQGLQYLANMASGDGKLEPLDNKRYPELKWTSLQDVLRDAKSKNSNK